MLPLRGPSRQKCTTADWCWAFFIFDKLPLDHIRPACLGCGTAGICPICPQTVHLVGAMAMTLSHLRMSLLQPARLLTDCSIVYCTTSSWQIIRNKQAHDYKIFANRSFRHRSGIIGLLPVLLFLPVPLLRLRRGKQIPVAQRRQGRFMHYCLQGIVCFASRDRQK